MLRILDNLSFISAGNHFAAAVCVTTMISVACIQNQTCATNQGRWRYKMSRICQFNFSLHR
jgi:hypothetical protein